MSNWNLNMSQQLEKPIFVELATGELARCCKYLTVIKDKKEKRKQKKKKKQRNF